MKATVHFGRGNANHNDRTYDKTEKEHDILLHTVGDRKKTFLENELDMYERLYEKKRLAINEKNIKNRQYKRCTKSIRDYYKNNPPTELILQIGDKDNFAKGEDLQDPVVELVNSLKREGVQILNIAIHQDETTEHAHIRMTFPCERNGLVESNKAQFLRDHGYERPNPDKKEDRYNNPLITFTNDVRERFIGICREKGLEIDSEPSQEHKRHLSVHQYKLQQENDLLQLEELVYKRKRAIIEKITEQLYEGTITEGEANRIIKDPEREKERVADLERDIFG